MNQVTKKFLIPNFQHLFPRFKFLFKIKIPLTDTNRIGLAIMNHLREIVVSQPMIVETKGFGTPQLIHIANNNGTMI